MNLLLLTFMSLSLFSYAQTANILFFFGWGAYSHRISVWPLVTTLAERGHNVTFATHLSPKEIHKHPNVIEFTPKQFQKFMLESSMFNTKNLIEWRLKNGRFQRGGTNLVDIGLEMCKNFISDPETKIWIQSSKFDLIVIDGLFNDCGFGLAHKFKSKIIVVGTAIMMPWFYEAYGISNDGYYYNNN